MATSESKGRFLQSESIRITNRFESRIGMLYCIMRATVYAFTTAYVTLLNNTTTC